MKKADLRLLDVGGVGVLVALTLAAYFTGVSPAVRAVRAAEEERTRLAERQAHAQGLERTLQQAQRKLEALESAERRELPRATALDRISRISEIAAANGVSLTDLSPRPEVKGTRFNRVPIVVAGLGPSASFEALLRDLHQEYPDVQVVSLTITANVENAKSPASLNAELAWYTIAENAAGSGRAGSAGGAGGQAQVPAK
jgi:Tfp pilus assembly protein PilO